jgi:hypothetical protein
VLVVQPVRQAHACLRFRVISDSRLPQGSQSGPQAANGLRRHLDRAATPALLHEQVTADILVAARLTDTGLHTFAAPA